MRARIALLVGLAAIAGCGDILGLNGYTGDLDASAEASVEAGVDAAKLDAAPLDAASCGSNAVCVPALPDGWTWATYSEDARPACATGYATPADVQEGIDAGPASCSCTCSVNQPSCTGGNVTITAGTNNTCDNATNQTDTSAANCHTLTQFTTSGGSSAAATGPAPSGGTCMTTPSVTTPPVGFDHAGRTCALAGDAGASCGAGAVCLPNPAPFASCVSQAGTQSCPSGFPVQHVVGTSVDDTRGCTACGCSLDAGTCGGTLTLYTNTGCSMGAQTVAVDGTCHGVGSHTFKSYEYAPTTNATCTVTSGSADGGVAFTDATTICCAQ